MLQNVLYYLLYFGGLVAVTIAPSAVAIMFFRLTRPGRPKTFAWMLATVLGFCWSAYAVKSYFFGGSDMPPARIGDWAMFFWIILYLPGVPFLMSLVFLRPRPFQARTVDVVGVIFISAICGIAQIALTYAQLRSASGILEESDLVAIQAAPKYRDGTLVEIEWNRWSDSFQLLLERQTTLERFRTTIPHDSEYLQFLKANGNLSTVDIEGGAADAKLADILISLEKLEKLLLHNPKFHGEGLEKLATLPRLAELDVSQTGIGDDDASHIAALTQLKTLRLDDTPLGDIGLSQLASLQDLEHLSLIRTEITDWGLGVVADFPRLKEVHVEGTRVTKNGIAALRAKRPQLVVVP